MEEHQIRPEEIREIRIVLQEIGRMVTEPREVKYRPQSPAVAKFSLPFVVGTAVVYGNVGLDSFTPERLSDPAVLAMGDKVTCLGVDYEVQAAQPIRVGETLTHWWAVLRVRDGEVAQDGQ